MYHACQANHAVEPFPEPRSSERRPRAEQDAASGTMTAARPPGLSSGEQGRKKRAVFTTASCRVRRPTSNAVTSEAVWVLDAKRNMVSQPAGTDGFSRAHRICTPAGAIRPSCGGCAAPGRAHRVVGGAVRCRALPAVRARTRSLGVHRRGVRPVASLLGRRRRLGTPGRRTWPRGACTGAVARGALARAHEKAGGSSVSPDWWWGFANLRLLGTRAGKERARVALVPSLLVTPAADRAGDAPAVPSR